MVATGLLLGSLFLVPILVFGTLPIGIMLPILKRPLVVVVAHTMSFVVPLGAELLHLVPRTFELTARGILLAPPYVTLPAPTMLAIEVLCIFVQLLSVSYILYSQRAAQDRAQEQLHVQAWQLAQLVRT